MAKTTTPDTSKANEKETPQESAKQETLVEKTPLGLSAEQMKKSNPEAVKQMEEAAAAKAKEEAKAESAKALDDLKAAFPEDLEFATTAHKEGLSVEQAKAKRYDDVVAKNKELETENADLKKKSEGMDVEFAGDSGEDQGAGDSGEDQGAGATVNDKELDNAAAKIWDRNANNLQAEFGNNKTSFFAYYKKRPHEFK